MRPGDRLGPYRIVGELGRGGFACVYEAVEEGEAGFERRVALKVLHEHVLESHPEIEAALGDEARILARMHHPNVVAARWFGRLDGAGWALVMEHVDGCSLRPLYDGQVEWGVWLQIFVRVARGLAYAHGLSDGDQPLRVVHRDLKPSNVMISRQGAVQVLDFGIAHAADRVADSTATGLVRGTLHYMAPEQVRADRIVDHRADQFALGVMIFEANAGRRLFRAGSVAVAVGELIVFDVEPLLPEVDPSIRPLLRTLLAKGPEGRFDTTDEVVAALEALEAEVRSPPLERFVAGWFEAPAASPLLVAPKVGMLLSETAALPEPEPWPSTLPPTRPDHHARRGGIAWAGAGLLGIGLALWAATDRTPDESPAAEGAAEPLAADVVAEPPIASNEDRAPAAEPAPSAEAEPVAAPPSLPPANRSTPAPTPASQQDPPPAAADPATRPSATPSTAPAEPPADAPPTEPARLRLNPDRSFVAHIGDRAVRDLEGRRGIEIPAGTHEVRLLCLDCPDHLDPVLTFDVQLKPGQLTTESPRFRAVTP